MTFQTDDLRIQGISELSPPAHLLREFPCTERAAEVVHGAREAVHRVLHGEDDRLVAVVGPCSIHDPVAALDYARRLSALAAEVAETLFLVMRVYFEKPRTSLGWKGFINDPRMDDSFRMDEGMERARRFLVDLAELGLPAGTEALDPIAPHYLGDLVAWTAIGARTAESQTHREMASGLSAPVGFKNGTDGDVQIAVNAIVSASGPHAFLGIDDRGRSAVVRTCGNRHCHLVLRGGGGRPNFDTVSIALAEEALERAGLPLALVVDCSHANSWKKPELQPLVMRDVVNQVRDTNRSVVGFMVESFLEAGSQPIPEDLSKLRYGCSVTDPCVGWDTTVEMVRAARAELRPVLEGRSRKA
jgi:3-deoxy-7-phosphoheptulonate synthase